MEPRNRIRARHRGGLWDVGRRWGRRLLEISPRSHYALLSLLLFVGLELIFSFQQFVLIVAVAVVSVVVFGTVLVWYEERSTFRIIHLGLPILTALGVSGFAFLLPTSWPIHVYFLGSGVLFYFMLTNAARQAYPLWNWAMSLIVLFLNTAFILGIHYSSVEVHLLLVLLGVFVVIFLISLQSLQRVVPKLAEAFVPSLVLAFVLTQVTWALQFMPSHYLVQASIVTILYYVIFNLLSFHYSSRLTKRVIVEYAVIGIIATVIIIVSAPWV